MKNASQTSSNGKMYRVFKRKAHFSNVSYKVSSQPVSLVFFPLFARNEMILYVCVRLSYFKITYKSKAFMMKKGAVGSAEDSENRIIDNENNKEPTIATISSQKSTLRCAMCSKSGTNIFKITLKGRFMNILRTIIAKYCLLDHFQFNIAIFFFILQHYTHETVF